MIEVRREPRVRGLRFLLCLAVDLVSFRDQEDRREELSTNHQSERRRLKPAHD